MKKKENYNPLSVLPSSPVVGLRIAEVKRELKVLRTLFCVCRRVEIELSKDQESGQ